MSTDDALQTITGNDIITALERGCEDCARATVELKDGTRVEGDLLSDHRLHPGKEYGVQTEVGVVGLDAEEVVALQLSGHFGPSAQPFIPPDGAELGHTGYCWLYRGDVAENFGHCSNPECVDPQAEPGTNQTGRYWGSRQKSLTCTCGGHVSLT